MSIIWKGSKMSNDVSLLRDWLRRARVMEKERLRRLIKREGTMLGRHEAICMVNHISLTSLEPNRQYLLGILKAYELIYGIEDTRQFYFYLWKRKYRALRLYLYWMR